MTPAISNVVRIMSSTLEEEWKSVFPISAVFRAPLLLTGPSAKDLFGPLVFNTVPSSLTRLFSSPSLLPSSSPTPILNLSRFLLTSSSIVPSTSSSIASLFGEQPFGHDLSSTLCCNCLQFLRSPNTNNVIVFFPTGPNSNHVGFLVISNYGSSLNVHSDQNNEVFTVESELNYQILGISVNPVAHLTRNSTIAGDYFVDIGYLLAYTMYSVEWFIVKNNTIGLSSGRIDLVHVGSKVFKTCSIIHVCWSPHLPVESVILLENGSLFLFDIEPFLETENGSTNVQFKGKRLRVSWDILDHSKKVKWLSCEFSWHPRILIVARSDAVFLVDLRADQCQISCLVKIETCHTYSFAENEQFNAFAKAGSDGFYFSVASNSLLLLCDIRKPLIPVLQWAHGLDDPYYMNVFSLSELRSNTKSSRYKFASESGYCIILGSFRSCEFNVFCYGPNLPASESISSRSSKFYQSLYAWELPSNLLLSGRECPCGNCLMKGSNLKDAVPEWVGWQQKKDIVLGFGILDNDLSLPLPGQNEYGGFTLVRLMSSGTLEAQNYQAFWKPFKKIKECHKKSLDLTNYLLHGQLVDEKYRFHKRFRYLNFECLMGYLNDNLDEVLDSYMRKSLKSSFFEHSVLQEFHEILCEKLKACGFDHLRSSPALTFVFNDISLSATVEEVALRKLWASLPIDLLQLAFSSYSEFLENKNTVSLEFLSVPHLPQLPPFMLRDPSNRSNKWSHKVQQTDGLVGPVLPLPVLLVLHEFRNGCSKLEEGAGKFSLEAELCQQYYQIKRAVGELAVSRIDSRVDDPAISLAEDRDYGASAGSQKSKPFCLYNPSAFNCHTLNNTCGNSIYRADIFDSLIFKLEGREPISSDKSEYASRELFSGLCPMELKFGARPLNLGSKELKAYNLLKRQLLKWEDSFDSYKDCKLA